MNVARSSEDLKDEYEAVLEAGVEERGGDDKVFVGSSAALEEFVLGRSL